MNDETHRQSHVHRSSLIVHRLWALHGFLGLDSDWDFLRPHFELVFAPPADAILGYSMGGRLALEELTRRTFKKAIIVSAGLNIEGETAREKRREHDEEWARRFEHEPWDELMRDWNAQAVFGGERNPLLRIESDFDRGALAEALRRWSPGVLPPLASRLGTIATPLLWIAGERDAKYIEEGRRAVGLLPDARLWICPGAGHRVPWEQPQRFIDRIKSFLEETE
jgi:2-succinyl-6-hydroxy-2,4-cyclohexadiene-1-carboxylate synthase